MSDQPSRFNKSGGYHCHNSAITSRCAGKGIHDSVFGAKSADLMNTLQKTGWRLMRGCWMWRTSCKRSSSRWDLCGSKFDRPTPGGADQYVVEDPERLKEWRRNARDHERYNEQYRRSIRTRKAMAMARQYLHKPSYLRGSSTGAGGFTRSSHGCNHNPLTLRNHCCGSVMAVLSLMRPCRGFMRRLVRLSLQSWINTGTAGMDRKEQSTH